jgi:DNA-binding transcriptional MerR regulator
MGMPTAQMQVFAEQVRSGDDTIPDRIALLEAHDAEVEAEMARLIEQRRKIRNKITWYRSVVDEQSGDGDGAGDPATDPDADCA